MGKIAIIGYGGTIVTQFDPVMQTRIAKYSLQEIIDRIEPLQELEIEPIDIRTTDSTELNEIHWKEIAEVTYQAIRRKDIEGIVITHGTDTMGFSASALSFMIQNLGKPIIFTGSQQSLDEIKSDAAFNLINSVNLASSDLSGVYICFGGLIIHGTRAAKTRSTSNQAFESINHPYISPFLLKSPFILTKEDQGQVRYESTPPLRNTELEPTYHPHIAENVFHMDIFPNIQFEPFVDFLVEQNYLGLVIKGYGMGNIPTALINRLNREDIHFPTILSTQCRYEGTQIDAYTLGKIAKETGRFISARDMTPETAFVKLKWMLGRYVYEYGLKPPFNLEMLRDDFHRPIAQEIF
ncbi:MAG: asparaginase [Candidatus Hodarchaeales archaeon]